MISVSPRSRVVGWTLFVAAMSLPLFAQDFYEQKLITAKNDRAAGRLVESADELRIAAFGFLDRPPLLSQALVNLALVQSALGQPAVPQTLERFLEVERRFSAYATAALDAPTRGAFEALLVRLVPRPTLVAIPSLARVMRSEAQKVSDLPSDKRAAAYEEGFRRAPRDLEWPMAAALDAASRNADEDAIRWARRALNIDKENDTARTVLAHSLTRRSDCREALSQISRFSADELRQRPELVGDQLVCLTSEKRWSDAEVLAPKLPDAVKQRTDVLRAGQTLAARRAAEGQKADASRPAATPGASMTSGAADAARPVAQPPAPVKPPAAMPQAQPPSPAKTAQTLASSRNLVNARRFSDAVQVLRPAVAADPANRQLRLALLEASTLAHDWQTAIAQVKTSTPFSRGEENSMFYAAATLYENGRKEEARPLMERARPNLNGTPMIDYYYRMIVGRGSSK